VRRDTSRGDRADPSRVDGNVSRRARRDVSSLEDPDDGFHRTPHHSAIRQAVPATTAVDGDFRATIVKPRASRTQPSRSEVSRDRRRMGGNLDPEAADVKPFAGVSSVCGQMF
jgi:hypothetical protein